MLGTFSFSCIKMNRRISLMVGKFKLPTTRSYATDIFYTYNEEKLLKSSFYTPKSLDSLRAEFPSNFQTDYRLNEFKKERERQLKNIPQLEKLQISLSNQPLGTLLKESLENQILSMNKHYSTPADCLKHFSDVGSRICGIAEFVKTVNDGKEEMGMWEMHRPLTEHGKLRFITYAEEDSERMHSLNEAYWRSCSMLLGWILETSFKEMFRVDLHSSPGADYRSGSFVYDCRIEGLDDWTPTSEETEILGRCMAAKIRTATLPFTPLEVELGFAQKLFKDNSLKLEQLESKLKENKKLLLCQVGDFVDLVDGPVISNTGQIGNFAVTTIKKFESNWGPMWRFQGVSVPAHHRIPSWTWDIIEKSSRRPNSMPYPTRKAKPEDLSSEIASNQDLRI